MLPIPVIGVIEPGSRTAIMTTKNQNVLILGTEGTIKSGGIDIILSTLIQTSMFMV